MAYYLMLLGGLGILRCAALAAGVLLMACVRASGALAQEGVPSGAQGVRPPVHDYPTAARADYVVGCLAANGFAHAKLDECACNIDEIANQMSYDAYEEAGTILSMQQASVAPRGGLFRDTPVARQSLERLRRAQAEANLRCAG